MKKALKIILFIINFIYLVNTVQASECEGIYSDVPVNHTNCKEIEFLYKQGTLSYTSLYYPNISISRAQFSKIIKNAFKIPTNIKGNAFPDFRENNTLYTEVMSLKNAGIINGKGSGNFEAGISITRGAALKMIIKAIDYNFPVNYSTTVTSEPITFSDIKPNYKLKDYIVAASNFSQNSGFKIIPEFTDNTFRPEDFITRAEAAKLIANAMIPLHIQKWQCSTSFCSDLQLNGYPVFNFELEIYLNGLINQSRYANNLQPFTYNDSLAVVSDNWNFKMSNNKNLNHNPNLTTEIIRSSIPFSYNGENVATRTVSDKFNPTAYFEAVKALHDTIMNQQTPNDNHKKNILSQSEAFDQIALSVMITQDYIDFNRNRVWLVENFISSKTI